MGTPQRGQNERGERIGGAGAFNPFITDKVGNRIPFEGLTPTAIDEQYGKGDACGRSNVEEKDEKDEKIDVPSFTPLRMRTSSDELIEKTTRDLEETKKRQEERYIDLTEDSLSDYNNYNIEAQEWDALDERQKEELDERALDFIEREENPKDWEEGDY